MMAIKGCEYDRQGLAMKAKKKKKLPETFFLALIPCWKIKSSYFFFEKLAQIYIQQSNLYNKWK